jgi:hypothetical protein
MSNSSTHLDVIFGIQESLEFEFALRREVDDKEEVVRAPVQTHSGAFK